MAEEELSSQKQSDSEIKTQETKKNNKGFSYFFYHPAFNVVCGIVTILSFIFGFYFYQKSKIYPQLIVYTHPVKATIVKAGQTSDIKTFYKDKEINTDVTVAQVAIWNQGNASIRREQILRPIVLSTDNNAPILEATIRKSTRDVIQLALNQDEIQNGRLPVSWHILEQNDGGVIQIVYAGDSQTNINIEGIIEGQNEIDKSFTLGKIKTPSEQYDEKNTRFEKFKGIFLVIVGLITGFLFLKWSITEIRENLSKRDYLGIFAALILLFLSFLSLFVSILVGFYEVVQKYPLPPFDFS